MCIVDKTIKKQILSMITSDGVAIHAVNFKFAYIRSQRVSTSPPQVMFGKYIYLYYSDLTFPN